ncbi:helix-turn-helix domain-containing protein [Herbaspirillum sp. RTI4]|uniref:helix-turn-helix domain-containing protein n=1 Tax=Herbaspirillum sp. RTI4 TaxID=3048640 RepID=UPI002AB3B626|nr:helix-turn-helix domain-containing protein [Herbaspirillum sp. RTI4]MDY7578359.1 helix-turn-helix domain-containing protein [Herbaspirillum sp. RTI4]
MKTANGINMEHCPHLLLLKPGMKYSKCEVRIGSEILHLEILSLDTALCLITATKIHGQLNIGDAKIKIISCSRLIKLLAFIDHNNLAPQSSFGIKESIIQVSIHDDRSITPSGLEKWFLLGIISGDSAVMRVAQMLRRYEDYSLVKFLLLNRDCSSIEVLGSRYGLSISHFRRKCKRALGTSIKREFRIWRAAGALLATAGHQFGLTNIALDHGYASSSHFSRDIRDLFGFSPTELYMEKILKRINK